MTQLYPHIAASTIELDEVSDTLDNIELYVAPLQAHKSSLFNSSCSFLLSNWVKIQNSDRFLAIRVLVNLNNISKYSLRVVEGYYDIESAEFHEGDGFVDVKTDKVHIEAAINDIKQGIIPLWNRDKYIDFQRFTYVLDDFV